MKLLKFALIIPIVYGCSSKNNSIEVLKENAQSYTEISNTVAYHSQDAILYFNIDGNRLNINLIDKSNEEELTIKECKLDKKTYIPAEYSSQELGKHYIINLATNAKKIKIECKLSNSQTVKKVLRRYWK